MSSLNCPQFTNQHGQDPCSTAQMADQVCVSDYTITTTLFQESLYIPNATTANPCTCSWASYNLLSACSYCVGVRNYTSWATWSASCGSNASSTTYFPSPLPSGIPYFAGTNPNNWTNGTFDPTQAANMGSGNHADLTGPTTTSTSSATPTAASSDTSAIIGSIVGALAFIFLIGLLLCFIVRRHRRQVKARHAILTHSQPPAVTPTLRTRPSQASMPMGQAPTSPYPVSAYGSSHGFSATSLHPISPTSTVTTVPFSPPISDAADMISPFLASPTRPAPGSSKVAEALAERMSSQPPPVPPRGRMNPPPYSPTGPGGDSPSQSAPSPSPPPNVPRKRSTKRYIKHLANGSVESANSGMPLSVENDNASPPPPQPRRQPVPRLRGAQMLSTDSRENNGSTVTLSSTGHAGDSARHHDAKVGQKGSITPRKHRPAL